MKKIIFAFILALAVTGVYANDNPYTKPTHSVGIGVDGGLAHGFLSKDLNAYNTSAYAKPYWGWFVGGELVYELEYKKFLMRVAFGTQYSVYQNTKAFDDRSHGITEYKTLTYHYRFTRFRERTSSGNLYVPIMVGAQFKYVYFLVGTKLGFAPYATKTQPIVKTHIWGTDEDVINPMEGLYTHYMDDYTFKGTKSDLAFNGFSATASAEVGVTLGRKQNAVADNASEEDIYHELHKKKSFAECLSYKISLFMDYGLTDLINHDKNLSLYHSSEAVETQDQLIDIPQTGKVVPHSLLAYKPNQDAVLNPLYVGVRFAVMYQFPPAIPNKYKHPKLVTYTRDAKTGEILRKSKVKMTSVNAETNEVDSTEQSGNKETGAIESSCPPGTYSFYATCGEYIPAEVKDYKHEDRYDTLYIDLLPPLKLRVNVIDDSTKQSISASVTKSTADDTANTSNHSVMKNKFLTLSMEYNQEYRICAMSKGYYDSCSVVTFEDTTLTIALRAKPKPVEPVKPVTPAKPAVRKFILRNMYFATDKTKVLPASESSLMQLYNFLNENPDVKIKIIGHTDDVASDAYNQKLSEGRAKSVKREMVIRGIDASRIKTEGHGEKDPVVPNTSAENRQENRRVEIQVTEGEVDVELIRGFMTEIK